MVKSIRARPQPCSTMKMVVVYEEDDYMGHVKPIDNTKDLTIHINITAQFLEIKQERVIFKHFVIYKCFD